jgi:hypothetical protein
MIVNRISQRLVRAPEPRQNVAAKSAQTAATSFAGLFGSQIKASAPAAATTPSVAVRGAAVVRAAATVSPTTTTPTAAPSGDKVVIKSASTGSGTAPPTTTIPTQPSDAGGGGSTGDSDHPTAQDVFGANPWLSAPGGVTPSGSYGFNPDYFATPQTAQKVAQLLGGTVVETSAMVGSNGPFTQSAPNQMVKLPNGHLINAGLTATYYTHGWSQAQINQMLQYDINS